jgi:O-antigen/teichoic acid export membrane protein
MVTWALQLIGAAVLTPLITRLVGTDEFGAVAAATAVMQVLFVVSGLGLATSLQRRYPGPDGPAEAARLLTLAMLLAGVLTVLADATGPVWSRFLGFDSYGGALRLAVYWAGTSAVTNASLALLRSRDRLLGFSSVSLLQSVGAAAASLVLVLVVAPTATVFVLGQLALQVAAAGLALCLAPPLRLRIRDKGLVREALGYGLPLVPALLCTFVLAAADRLMVQGQLGLTQVARYQVAYNVGDMPILLLGVLTTAWMPRIFGLNVSAERAAVITASRDALYRLLIPVIIGLSLGSPLVLRVWAPPEYRPDELLVVTAVVIVSAVPYTAALAVSRALLAEGRTRTIAGATAVAAATNIALNLVLISRFGLVGAAVATFVAYAVQHRILLLRVGAVLPLAASSLARLSGLAGAAAVALLSTAAPTSPGYLVLRSVLVLICVVWFFRVLIEVSSGRSITPAGLSPRPSGRHHRGDAAQSPPRIVVSGD